MATYRIKAMYTYEGDIEANSPEEAEKIFLSDLNSHYSDTYDYECEEIDMCDECDCEVWECECSKEEGDNNND